MKPLTDPRPLWNYGLNPESRNERKETKMKLNLKALKSRIQGDVLPTNEHHSVVLTEEALRAVKGGLMAQNSPSCCPNADDCED